VASHGSLRPPIDHLLQKRNLRVYCGSGSIVFVEDNRDVARPVVVALEQAGYRVMLFVDANSALAWLSDLQPHAILLDSCEKIGIFDKR
jgi:PleD family two-component response regulator